MADFYTLLIFLGTVGAIALYILALLSG
jgi:hypothetical protein